MKQLYPATRNLHLYVGLFLSPFLALFAVSTLMLNHRWLRPATTTSSPEPTSGAQVTVSGEPGSISQAKDFLRQLHLSGEIDYVRHNAKAGRLFIPVTKPGVTTTVDVDLRSGRATVQQQDSGLAGALAYLHRMPGPHNVRFRGNWLFMTWWSVLTDAVVCGSVLLTVSGLYLWWMLKAERAIGWTLLVAGASTVTVLVTAICTA